MIEEEATKKPSNWVLGADLSRLGLAELAALKDDLKGEIERVAAEEKRKQAQRGAAESLFKSG